MSEDTYDLSNIADKQNFSVLLDSEIEFLEPFFEVEEKLLTSYLDETTETNPSEELVTSLISETPKGIIRVEDSYFHYFSDFIGPIYVFLENCIKNNIEDVEIIGVVVEPELQVVKNFYPFLEHCLQHFSDRINVTYTGINENLKLSDFDKGFIRINNFRKIDQQDIGISANFLYEKSKTFSEFSDITVPDRKVFISRRNDAIGDRVEARSLYEEDVENFFVLAGFEVISGESFETIKDQMAYFHDVRVFAGYTGAGLTSSMFMQPGQTIVEIVCPIRFSDNPRYEIHNFYKTISMLKKHRYVAVSNINNSKEDLLKDLEKNQAFFN
jgi:hypothetical protein